MHGPTIPLSPGHPRALLQARDLWLTVPARPGMVNVPGADRESARGASLDIARGASLDTARGASLDIVRGASLDLAEGESVGIIGPSGSGKTSLLMLLAGLERPTRGSIIIDGTDFGQLSEDARARFRGQHVGIVFQSFHLIPTMTALENVAIPLELAGRRDALARAALVLDQVGLSHRLGHRPGELSGGEQQRVALARAFAPNPRLLLADEPTGNLDLRTGKKITDLMFALQRDHGTALLLITHDATLAARCDRVLQVSDGILSQCPVPQPAARS